MTRIDPSSTALTVQAINPASYGAVTTNSAAIDARKHRIAKIIAGFGVMGADATINVQESATSGGTYATITGGTFVLASGTYADDKAIIDVDLSPRLPFIRIQLVTTVATLSYVAVVLQVAVDTRFSGTDEATREALILS